MAEGMSMIEVKADCLEASFEAVEHGEDVAALKSELALLKRRIDEGVIAAQKPMVDGVKAAQSSSFVDQYLRQGNIVGLEQKALGSSADAIGGYAVPREIDEEIANTLLAISPIRAIANVVKVGTANYRKLVSTGGTPSGWVGYEAARPETTTEAFSEIVPAAGDLYANPAANGKRRPVIAQTQPISLDQRGHRVTHAAAMRGIARHRFTGERWRNPTRAGIAQQRADIDLAVIRDHLEGQHRNPVAETA